MGHPEFARHFLCPTAQNQLGLAARLVGDFNVQPTHPFAPPCAQGLERSFLCRKARSVALCLVLELLAISYFSRRTNSFDETFPILLETLSDPCCLGNINTCPHNHSEVFCPREPQQYQPKGRGPSAHMCGYGDFLMSRPAMLIAARRMINRLVKELAHQAV
jgi:hypothetical protein